MHHKAHLRNFYKWITDWGAIKHMTPHKTEFDTYEVIYLYNVRLDDESVAKAI